MRVRKRFLWQAKCGLLPRLFLGVQKGCDDVKPSARVLKRVYIDSLDWEQRNRDFRDVHDKNIVSVDNGFVLLLLKLLKNKLVLLSIPAVYQKLLPKLHIV